MFVILYTVCVIINFAILWPTLNYRSFTIDDFMVFVTVVLLPIVNTAFTILCVSIIMRQIIERMSK